MEKQRFYFLCGEIAVDAYNDLMTPLRDDPDTAKFIAENGDLDYLEYEAGVPIKNVIVDVLTVCEGCLAVTLIPEEDYDILTKLILG